MKKKKTLIRIAGTHIVLFILFATETLPTQQAASSMRGLQSFLLLLCTLLFSVSCIEASPQTGSSSSSQSGSATSTGSSLPTSTSTVSNSSISTSGDATLHHPRTGTNFAGSNLYYAAGLSAEQRRTYLS